MTDFIAMIYEWFGYSTDLGTHLRGWDVTCSDFTGTDLYFKVFITMISINIALFIVMYFIIDRLTTRYSTKISWWITAIIGSAINFGIASSLPSTVEVCTQLHFNGGDQMLFGLANAVWSIFVFAILTSFPIPRNFSNNCRLTTFWKP